MVPFTKYHPTPRLLRRQRPGGPPTLRSMVPEVRRGSLRGGARAPEIADLTAPARAPTARDRLQVGTVLRARGRQPERRQIRRIAYIDAAYAPTRRSCGSRQARGLRVPRDRRPARWPTAGSRATPSASTCAEGLPRLQRLRESARLLAPVLAGRGEAGRPALLLDQPRLQQGRRADGRLAATRRAGQPNVRAMVASKDPLQLVTTFNEWGEGTASKRHRVTDLREARHLSRHPPVGYRGSAQRLAYTASSTTTTDPG